MTAEEKDVVRGSNKWKGSVAGLGGLSRPVGVFLFNFCCRVYTSCLFGMSVSFQTCLCVLRVVSEGQQEACVSF